MKTGKGKELSHQQLKRRKKKRKGENENQTKLPMHFYIGKTCGKRKPKYRQKGKNVLDHLKDQTRPCMQSTTQP